MTSNFKSALAVAVSSLTIGLLGSAPANGQQLPDWRPGTICAQDSARGQCVMFEHRARRGISASWDILPEKVRQSCLLRFTAPLEPSWRILGDCLEIEGRLAQSRKIAAKRKRDAETLAALRTNREKNTADREAAKLRAKQAQLEKARLAREEQRRRRLADAEQRRIEKEKATFLETLEAQRRQDALAAKRKAEAKRAAAAVAAAAAASAAAKRRAEAQSLAESRRLAAAARRSEVADDKRIEEEKSSFLALLAEQRRQDAEARERAKAAKKIALAKSAEAERRRVEAERQSFMRQLEAQRRADAAAARRKAAAKEANAARAAEAERRRVAAEEATFMAMLAAQRRADAAEEKRAAAEKAAKAKVVTSARKQAAESCQARLKKVKSTGVILFEYNSAALNDSAGTALLDRLADAVGQCEGQLLVEVEGHTDSRGSAESNVVLSKARAETVAKYLRTRGIAADRISSLGRGETRPIASNATREGRARNRRIEFKVK